jgi:uncharacterized damage-inducible protein DinB
LIHPLLDPFRHNAWANQELVRFCRALPEAHLGATAPGAFGTVIDTLAHVLGSEARYLFLLTDRRPDWGRTPDERPDLADLAERAAELAGLWEALLAAPLDPDRWVVNRRPSGQAYRCAVGAILTQALNHGNEHRDQICTILTTLGHQPPELDGWSYGLASGRIELL